MKIAFLGIRGIPASYSVFETFVEQTAVRLAERGYDVTVYNRKHHYEKVYKEYKGVRIVTLPSIENKHFDTISHTFLSVLHSLFQKYDVVERTRWFSEGDGEKGLVTGDEIRIK